jgi:hypothetical protein
MSHRLHSLTGPAALVVSTIALGLAVGGVAQSATSHHVNTHPAASTKVQPYGLLRLSKSAKFPAKVIPTVAQAQRANRVGGKTVAEIEGSCAPTTIDLGTWCMDASNYPIAGDEVGKNDYFFATQKCIDLGGYLPSAAQLIGSAKLVRLSSTIDDSTTDAIISDPLTTDHGLKDLREMSGDLVTTVSGSDASGSEGVSDGSTGDPHLGQPNPAPQPANPGPETLQYVTVFDNHDKGGFAGSEPVTQPERFRCAYDKAPGASEKGGD